MPIMFLAAGDLATAASGLPSSLLATNGLAMVASDMPIMFLAAGSSKRIVFNSCLSPPGSHIFSCGRLRGVMPPSSYFLVLSRCDVAKVQSASGSMPMVARTVSSDSFEISRCRFGQSFPLVHATKVNLLVTTFNCLRM